MGQGVIAEVERAAAMSEPAHDDLAWADELLAVDAEVLAAAGRPAGDDQAPCDQRRSVIRPAVLDGQAAQVDLAALEHFFLASAMAPHARLHVPQRLDHLEKFARVFQTLGWVGLLQAGQHPANVAQIGEGLSTHAKRNAACCPKKIGQS